MYVPPDTQQWLKDSSTCKRLKSTGLGYKQELQPGLKRSGLNGNK